MKTKMKALTLVLCAMLLVVASVMGTLAYLNATSEVVQNTFTVGNVAITLDEAKVNLYGLPVDANDNVLDDVDDAPRVLGNEYKLLPGRTYTKDPTVTVAKGSEKCFVRMIVTITDYQDVLKVLGDDFLPQNFVAGWDSQIWASTGVITVSEDGNTATYEFRYMGTVDAREDAQKLPALFTSFTMAGNVENADLALLEEMEINVVAHAMQADGFEDNVEAAWAAFDEQNK